MLETSSSDQTIVRWLGLCLFLIFAMVILGGVTRLTDSVLVDGQLASDTRCHSTT